MSGRKVVLYKKEKEIKIMASSRISLDTAALRSSAAQVKGIAGNLENELHSLEQIIASTADVWEGSA